MKVERISQEYLFNVFAFSPEENFLMSATASLDSSESQTFFGDGKLILLHFHQFADENLSGVKNTWLYCKLA